MGICYIVGAGNTDGVRIAPGEGDLVIAADAGWLALREWGILPHLAVGDFDSLGDAPAGVPVVRHPVRKDETDMALAVEEGLARGYRQFALLGGVGGRTDHTLANLQLLTGLARRGCKALLLGADCAAMAVSAGASWRMRQETGTVSVFCLGREARGVTVTGLSYEAQEITLTDDCPLGVSNAFIGAEAAVQVADGTVLVWWEPDGTENALKCLE